jgi:hypothetical protein
VLNLIRALLPNPWVRAQLLNGLRLLGAAASGFAIKWLIAHGVADGDAAAIGAALAALILGGGSALYGILDVNGVDKQQKQAVANTAHTVASGIESGAVTAPAIASQASAALALGNGASKRLASTIAALKADAA